MDGIKIEDVEAMGIEKYLTEIKLELMNGKYKPSPVKRVMIPKPDGSERPLGIPTVKDRIVQMATKIAIEPVFEADFRECSYGFRPKRSAKCEGEPHARFDEGKEGKSPLTYSTLQISCVIVPMGQ